MADLNFAFQNNYLTSSYHEKQNEYPSAWSNFIIDEPKQEKTKMVLDNNKCVVERIVVSDINPSGHNSFFNDIQTKIGSNDPYYKKKITKGISEEELLKYGMDTEQIDLSEYGFTGRLGDLQHYTYTKHGKLFNGAKFVMGNLVLTYSGNDIVQFERYIRSLETNQDNIDTYTSDFIEDNDFMHHISSENSGDLMYSGVIDISYNGQRLDEFEEFMKQITKEYDNIQYYLYGK